jgi:hypothetical protein
MHIHNRGTGTYSMLASQQQTSFSVHQQQVTTNYSTVSTLAFISDKDGTALIGVDSLREERSHREMVLVGRVDSRRGGYWKEVRNWTRPRNSCINWRSRTRASIGGAEGNGGS